jgi:hypothetical protein
MEQSFPETDRLCATQQFSSVLRNSKIYYHVYKKAPRTSAPSQSNPVTSLSHKLKNLLIFVAANPEVRVRFPALPDFLRSSVSGTGSTQPREYN